MTWTKNIFKILIATGMSATASGGITALVYYSRNGETLRRFIDISFYTSGAIFLVGAVIVSISIREIFFPPIPESQRKKDRRLTGAIWDVSQETVKKHEIPSNITIIKMQSFTWLGIGLIAGSLIWWLVAYSVYSRSPEPVSISVVSNPNVIDLDDTQDTAIMGIDAPGNLISGS